MKIIGTDLQANYASGTPSVAYAIKITRRDGETFGETSSGAPATVDGFLYAGSNLVTVSNLVTSAGFQVDNAELEVVPNAQAMTAADIHAGRWNRARFEIRRFNHLAPEDGGELLRTGTLGEFTLRNGKHTVELRSLKQALQQPIGIVTQKTCRTRLGAPDCGIDLSGSPPLVVTGTLTAVDGTTPRLKFTDSARDEADDWFGDGLLTFTDGDNAGLSQKIRAFAGGAFELCLPMPFDVQVGDEYEATPGCRLRFAEDCVLKWNNGLNFQGEPDVPGPDPLTAPPSHDD